MSTIAADVDADGRNDTISVYGTGSEGSPGPWQISVDLAAGGRRVAPIIDADQLDERHATRVLGSSTVGRTRTIFITVGVGSSTSQIGLFQMHGCDLTRISNGQARPVALAVGGTVTHLDGLRCEPDGGLTVLSATSNDGVTYFGTTASVAIADATMTTAPSSPRQLGADEVSAYGQLSCPGVESP